MDITTLLDWTIEKKASDLHLSTGMPPLFRIDGELCSFDYPTLRQQDVINMIDLLMGSQSNSEPFEADFSYEYKQLARFRVNTFMQDRGHAVVLRCIPIDVPSMEQLQLPSVFKQVAAFSHGLVLVTGPTGSGKSTTLAAIIDYINQSRHQHIITIEDPIEFRHFSKKSLINQREVFRDTPSFNAALQAALRQDPDIILVGELRDRETMQLAMTAAETGHLVFATLHTSSAAKTINRMIDVFPGEDKSMIRSMLSGSLQAVIAQTLLKQEGGGRVAAFEIMLATPAIRTLIREDKVAQMYSAIQTGKIHGMQTLDQDLIELLRNNRISREIACEAAINKDIF